MWLYVVLLDGIVKEWEAYLTLGFFVMLILMAYIADCLRRKTIESREAAKYGHHIQAEEQLPPGEAKLKDKEFPLVSTKTAYEFYAKLLPLEQGGLPDKQDEQMTTEMKQFLQHHFGTTRVSQVNKDDLKAKLEGPALIERIAHRKAVALTHRREAVAKGQVLRRENRQASSLKDHQCNSNYGFSCLHYSVSEGAGTLVIKVLNKTKKPGTVHVRTIDGDAQAGKDYDGVDEPINFTKGQEFAEIKVGIHDDEEWEPDEDFFVELYDGATGQRLTGEDTRTRVTILDDDNPGMLVFREKKILRHPAGDQECVVDVDRIQGTDGTISVKYKTIPLGSGDQMAKEGRDYEPISGTLEFANTESSKQIRVKIMQREDPEEERDEIFGVKLYDAEPSAVKISKKDTCVV